MGEIIQRFAGYVAGWGSDERYWLSATTTAHSITVRLGSGHFAVSQTITEDQLLAIEKKHDLGEFLFDLIDDSSTGLVNVKSTIHGYLE